MSDRPSRRLLALALVVAVAIGLAIAAGTAAGGIDAGIGAGAGEGPSLTALVDDHGVVAGRRSDDGPSRADVVAAVLGGVVVAAALAGGPLADGTTARPASVRTARLPRRRGPPAA